MRLATITTLLFIGFIYYICSRVDVPFPAKWGGAIEFSGWVIVGGALSGLLLQKFLRRNSWQFFAYWSAHCIANLVILVNAARLYRNLDNPVEIGGAVANIGMTAFALMLFAEIFLRLLNFASNDQEAGSRTTFPVVTAIIPIWIFFPLSLVLYSFN